MKAHSRFFAPASFWNTEVPADAPVDPRSPELVAALAATAAREAEAEIGPWISTNRYSVPVYRVPAEQPTVEVRLAGHPADGTLRAAWRRVPLPAKARPAAGSDGHLVVWQPHSDRLWEFWRLRRTPAGWVAGWGGAIRHASRNSGAYSRRSWPGSQPWWGASASSLSIAGGLITLEDLEAGEINHALAISLPEIRAGAYALPARRSDGTSPNPLALPEGAHLQLDPSLDVASLGLPRMARMIAEAAQRYGIFVRDIAGDVTFYGQDPTPTGSDPYDGPGGYFAGRTPVELLAHFPWDRLRVLGMRLRPDPHAEEER
ncbi:MAG: hypothetical protein ABW065_10010 [Solirubrobacterales bacterium]